MGRTGLEKALLTLRLSRLGPMDACAQQAWVERAQSTTLKRCRDEYGAHRSVHALRQSDPGPAAPADLRPLDDATWHASIRRTPGQTRAFVLDVGCRVLDREQAGRWSPVVCKALRLPEDVVRSFAAAIDAVLERDGYRCTSPGCTQRATLEVHHLRYRSNGGGNEPGNLVTFCAFHHRLGEHGMHATCKGTAPLGVLWGLGRADLRTWYRNDVRVPGAA